MAENSKVDVYSVYVKKFYRAIPKESVLITRDTTLNGNYVKVKRGGFAFVRPWAESKFIKINVQNRDYPKMEFDDKAGQKIFYDFFFEMKIIDPIKFEYANEDVEKVMKTKIQSLIGTALRKADWEELSAKDIKLPNTSDINSDASVTFVGGKWYKRDSFYKDDDGKWCGKELTEFDIEMYHVKKELEDTLEEYGIEVVSLYKKDVQQSEKMQEYYHKKKKKEIEMDAALIEAKQKREIAKVNAETRKIDAQAESDARKINIKGIVDGMSGMSDKAKSSAVDSYILTNGSNNANIYAAINSNSNNDSIQSGIVGGITASNEQKRKTR